MRSMRRFFLFLMVILLFSYNVMANDLSDRKLLVLNVSISNDFKISVDYDDGLELFVVEEDITINSDANFFENIILYFNQLVFWLENR